MLERIIEAAFTEYGLFVTFLILTIGVLSYTIKILWKRNEHLGDKFIEALENSTLVMTQVKEKLEKHHD
jgi:hypothetical protein